MACMLRRTRRSPELNLRSVVCAQHSAEPSAITPAYLRSLVCADMTSTSAHLFVLNTWFSRELNLSSFVHAGHFCLTQPPHLSAGLCLLSIVLLQCPCVLLFAAEKL